VYHKLGKSPTSASVIKPVLVDTYPATQIILGVAASDFHSVLWTNSDIYTCGLHAGQLGHSYSEDTTIPTFRKVFFTQQQWLTVVNDFLRGTFSRSLGSVFPYIRFHFNSYC
jgi:alpha-tubulin suppressor-like RCC1 family protein